MADHHRLDEDAEGFEEDFDDVDDEAFPHIQQYYASLTPDLRGDGHFDTRLANFHEGVNVPEERYFCSRPKSLAYLNDDPRKTPADHPLRAIAWVLESAPPNLVVRVFCYSLTDPIAIDLIVHAGSSREVKVILHPNNRSKRALEEFVDQHGKSAFLENVEMRLANLTGADCESSKVQMHDKSIITDTKKNQATITVEGVPSEIVPVAVFHTSLHSVTTNCHISTSTGQAQLVITPANVVCS